MSNIEKVEVSLYQCCDNCASIYNRLKEWRKISIDNFTLDRLNSYIGDI